MDRSSRSRLAWAIDGTGTVGRHLDALADFALAGVRPRHGPNGH
jgi:hypothetical protein